MAKTRRPTDSTLRNVRSANKKLAALAKRVATIEAALNMVLRHGGASAVARAWALRQLAE